MEGIFSDNVEVKKGTSVLPPPTHKLHREFTFFLFIKNLACR